MPAKEAIMKHVMSTAWRPRVWEVKNVRIRPLTFDYWLVVSTCGELVGVTGSVIRRDADAGCRGTVLRSH